MTRGCAGSAIEPLEDQQASAVITSGSPISQASLRFQDTNSTDHLRMGGGSCQGGAGSASSTRHPRRFVLRKLNVDIPDQDAVQHEEPSTDEPVLVDQDGRPRAKLLGGQPMHEDAKHARAVRDEVRGEVTSAARPRPRTVTGLVTAPIRAPSARKLSARGAPWFPRRGRRCASRTGCTAKVWGQSGVRAWVRSSIVASMAIVPRPRYPACVSHMGISYHGVTIDNPKLIGEIVEGAPDVPSIDEGASGRPSKVSSSGRPTGLKSGGTRAATSSSMCSRATWRSPRAEPASRRLTF